MEIATPVCELARNDREFDSPSNSNLPMIDHKDKARADCPGGQSLRVDDEKQPAKFQFADDRSLG